MPVVSHFAVGVTSPLPSIHGKKKKGKESFCCFCFVFFTNHFFLCDQTNLNLPK
jgi:hypothetical protein